MSVFCKNCKRTKNIFHKCPGCNHITCKPCLQKYLCTTNNLKCSVNECQMNFKRQDVIKMLGPNWFYGMFWYCIEKNIITTKDKQLLESYKSQIIDYEKCVLKLETDYSRNRIVLYHTLDDMTETIRQIRTSKQTHKEIVSLTRKCPNNDCLGMISINKNEKAECSLCQTVLCKECLEIVVIDEDEHVCNPDILENVKRIFKDTKPCPGCGVSIYKIEGCYQMWCTMCHTTFHYRTGEILNERVHNPHYVAWLNAQHNTRQVPIEEHGLNYTTIHRIAGEKGDNVKLMTSIYRILIHIQQIEIPSLNHNLRNIYNDDIQRDYRASYIMKKHDLNYYKDWLYKQNKHGHKYADLHNIYVQALEYIQQYLTRYITTVPINVDVPVDTLVDVDTNDLERLKKQLNELNVTSLNNSQLYENKFPQFLFENGELIIKNQVKNFKLKMVEFNNDVCQICTDKFNKTMRKRVQCTNCNLNACTTCISKYLLDSINEEHCMNCKKVWNRNDLIQYMGISWYTNKFKNHRKDILFEREKLQIQDTMELVERLKVIDQLYVERSKIYQMLTYNEQVYKQQKNELNTCIRILNQNILYIKNRYYPPS